MGFKTISIASEKIEDTSPIVWMKSAEVEYNKHNYSLALERYFKAVKYGGFNVYLLINILNKYIDQIPVKKEYVDFFINIYSQLDNILREEMDQGVDEYRKIRDPNYSVSTISGPKNKIYIHFRKLLIDGEYSYDNTDDWKIRTSWEMPKTSNIILSSFIKLHKIFGLLNEKKMKIKVRKTIFLWMEEFVFYNIITFFSYLFFTMILVFIFIVIMLFFISDVHFRRIENLFMIFPFLSSLFLFLSSFFSFFDIQLKGNKNMRRFPVDIYKFGYVLLIILSSFLMFISYEKVLVKS